jgi:hypothetical protein
MRITTVTIVIQKCGHRCPWWSTENVRAQRNRHPKQTHAVEWVGPFPEFCDLELCDHYVLATPPRKDGE